MKNTLKNNYNHTSKQNQNIFFFNTGKNMDVVNKTKYSLESFLYNYATIFFLENK
jgi:hypothetical protein